MAFEPEFSQQAAPIFADLRKLEAVAANAAGLLTAVLQDAESERAVASDPAAAIETLIAQLSMS